MAEQVGATESQNPLVSPWPSREIALDGGSPERVGHPGRSAPSSRRHAAIFPPGRPALLVRAARHYEGAGQILIRQAVMTAQHFVSMEPVELPALGQWVRAECPARVDFSGELLLGLAWQ